MEKSFKSILDYVRNIFTLPPVPDRKRRAAAPVFNASPKVSRFSPYGMKSTGTTHYIPIQREDISAYFPCNTESAKRVSPHQTHYRTPMKPIKLEDVVVLDDDDDVIEIKKNGTSSRNASSKTFTSTPVEKTHRFTNNKSGYENGDDLIFVKAFKSPKEKNFEAKLAGYDYFKPRSLSDKPLFTIGTTCQNGTKPKDKPKYKTPSNKSRGSSAMEYSFRLDDKLKYKKLLEHVSNDSSVYATPTGKIFPYDFSDFDKKSQNRFSFDKSLPKETTKDRIIKVLDGLESDALVKDSDSESSVVIVNPPSPKPDIKVDPVNSFKHYVNNTDATKKDWLNELLENHKQYVDERQKEIDHLRKCSQETEKINKDIGIELLRRKVDDCLKLKETILPEIVVEPEDELPELNEEQLYMVQRAFRGDPNEVLARKFNLNITRRDLMTLAGLNWLNDEVINFYMNLIIERGKDAKWPKSYAFNTFFYTKLLKDGPQSLRRWTKRVDLFAHDLVCVPIHLGMHWCMAIIDFRDKSIRYYDSMGNPNNRCLEALRHYLDVEHLDKKGSKYNISELTLENREDIPQQMNGSDCGMFACTFAEFITRNAKITFKQEDMPYMRKKMVVEIMTGELLMR